MKFPSMARAKGFQALGAGVSGMGELIFKLSMQRAEEQRQNQQLQMDTRRLDLQDKQVGLEQKRYDQGVTEYNEAPGRAATELASRHTNDLELEKLRSTNNIREEGVRNANDVARQNESRLDDDLEGIAAGMWGGSKGSLGSTGAWSAMRAAAPKAPAGRLLGAAGRARQRYLLDVSGPPSAKKDAGNTGGGKPTISRERAQALATQYMSAPYGLDQQAAQKRVLEKYNIK